MQFELPQDTAAGLINLLAKLPNETMTYPLVVELKNQFEAQLNKPEPTHEVVAEANAG